VLNTFYSGFRLRLSQVEYPIFLVCGWFLASRLLLTITGLISRNILDPNTGLNQYEHPVSAGLPTWLGMWGVWDSQAYLRISVSGYPAGDIDIVGLPSLAQRAFFPLYPTLMNLLGSVIGNNYLAGLIISNLCLLGCGYLLYKLVNIDYGQKLAKLSVIFLFLFPTSFIFSGLFTESLFMFLLLLTIYLAKTKKYMLAGLAAALLTATRSSGIFVIISLIFIYFLPKLVSQFSARNINLRVMFRETLKQFSPAKIFSLALVPMGLISYAIYTKITTGSFLTFIMVQEFWGRSAVNPIFTIGHNLLYGGRYGFWGSAYTITTLVVLLVAIRKLRLEYLLLSCILIIFPLLSSPLAAHLSSMPRYIATVFPLFIALALITKNSKALRWLCFILLAISQILLMFFWVNGTGWVV